MLAFLQVEDFVNPEEVAKQFANQPEQEYIPKLHQLLRPHLLRRLKVQKKYFSFFKITLERRND